MKEKQLFVLVKGYLQGAVKNPKKASTKNKLQINKKSFLDSFKTIMKLFNNEKIFSDTLNYAETKNLNQNYNLALKQFYSIYKGWIKTDPNKYYQFN